MKKILGIALLAMAPLGAQPVPVPDVTRVIEDTIDRAVARAQQTSDERREQREREAQDRLRERQERAREGEDVYREGSSSIDEQHYDRAVDRFDRVIENKSPRSDGAYYWKAYALNKLGKRDEALAALAEIPKQFPQSRWINDAKALQVEIQQASGTGVPPEGQSDQDLKLLAINALINSEPDRTIPLLEKVVNDPKNNLGIKARALFVLAQNRSDKARDIVAQYAKSGANPDLQMRAVGYLGAFRSKDSQQILADVYAANNDVSIRRAVLRSLMISRDAAHLASIAKTEQNVDLRREAIRDLGMIRATPELAQLYSTESNADLKESIIESLWIGRDVDKLSELAKNEKDARLRGDAIQRLGMLRDPKSADALAAMYASEPDKNVKGQIVNALWMGGACKQLVEAMRAEKDPALKTDGVRRLGMMKGCKEGTDYLLELISK
jgi:tetratricopeptide (TPR) repeat protein